jgi:hypothetical protein
MCIGVRPATRGNQERILGVAAILLLTVALTGCLGSSSANGGGPPPPVPSAALTFCDDGDPACTPANSFSVASVRDLVIKVSWDNLSVGNHVQTLEILMPAGAGLYQSTQTAFLTDSASSGTFAATRLLPVAGTWIQQRQMTGDWLIRVSLDDQVVSSQMVALNP